MSYGLLSYGLLSVWALVLHCLHCYPGAEETQCIVYASAPLGGANAYMFYSPFFVVVFRSPRDSA